ncbi:MULTISPECIES: hypothetical protein [Arthrobacter]|uniref:Heme peroxidase n=1 Tax=Arthrobacter terricola TaxID=2547396 RepID=A0A4R5KB66_9MICC|nr:MULTISPECIES: hypothetical protein [Arthrobacter]MBT8162617.1 hypothetical protein [Arthrobacter sp. GN70]TDF92399.1 hypothetical protein E1809_17810 [Arthrobacter terricola]
MTFELQAAADRLTEVCRTIFGEPSTWIEADGYPDSLALCIIDSIFSTGSHYTSVSHVVTAYRSYRRAQGGDPDTDGTAELLATFGEVGGSTAWAELVVDNHKPAHSKPGALLKAEVIYRAAAVLDDSGVPTVAALHQLHQADEDLTDVKEAWLRLPSQGSGVTFNYLLILAGLPSVKPDRMVIRFIEEYAGLTTALTPAQTTMLITEVAKLYPADARRLDHVIWRYASGREFRRAEPIGVGTVD